MLKHFLRRIQFLLKSTNQHGVHSPFVYSYLTEGIYNTKKSYKGYRKRHRLMQATIAYFQVKEIHGKPRFEIYLSKEKQKPLDKVIYHKLSYIESVETYSSDELEQLIKSVDDNTILYIDNPHQSIKAMENWEILKADKKFHVSIDFFVAGILFTRQEQIKEHFTLRV